MNDNAYKMSLLFLFFVGIGIVARMFLIQRFGGGVDDFGIQDLACVFALC